MPDAGLAGVVVSLGSGIAGVVTGFMSVKKRVKGDNDARWWIISTVVLAVPVFAMLALA